MDTSETSTGKRERAPVEGAAGSDIPTQSIDKKGRLGEPHPAFVTVKGVVKRHTQWRRPEMQENIDTQSQMDPGAAFMLDGGGPALPARVAEECKRILGQELAEEAERHFADLVNKAKAREIEEWEPFKVSPGKQGAQTEDLVETRRAPTWEEVGGVKTVKARSVAEKTRIRICAWAMWILLVA